MSAVDLAELIQGLEDAEEELDDAKAELRRLLAMEGGAMTTHREDQIWWLTEHAAIEQDIRHWPPSLRPHAHVLRLAAMWVRALAWVAQSMHGRDTVLAADVRRIRDVAARLEALP